jgi:hypothetical protein
MDKRRFKVGDKVLITLYDPNKDYKFGFVDEMRVYCGHIMTIRAVFDEDLPADQVDYRLVEDESNYMWSLSMFDPTPIDEDFIDMDLIM